MKLSRSLLVFLAVALAACIDNNSCASATNNPTPVASPSASPSPSPSGSPLATVACTDFHVFVPSFGWDGPAGQVRPPNQQQPYPLCTRCESVLTATLKGPSGDLPLAISSGKGRPEWTLPADSIGKLDITTEGTNNPDGYNLKVTPATGAGVTLYTVHVVVHALCIGEPPAGDFKYQVTAS